MRVRFARLAAAALGSALLVGPLASGASAHERRTVGTVQMVVGWLNEPAYAGFLNAVQLRVSDGAGPITDVGDALKVEVTFGDQKAGPLPLAPAFGSPGEYRSPMVPSRPGTYTFRFVGTVKGQQIDESFTSSDRTFDSPQDAAEIQFPVKDPSPGQLATRIERVEPRIEEVRTAATSQAGDAESAATRATVLAVLGLVVGAAGLASGVSARRRRPTGPAAPAPSSAKAATGS
ncbi:MAG TPA: hypothetical protein VM388_00715 [Acidimicrobiales bacterium]|nr:hypothetical protein [Acidimicrobiales bacterium]